VEPAHQITASSALGDALERLAYRQGYPGPLGSMDREAFLDASAPYAPKGKGGPAKGDRLLGRVVKRTTDTVTVELIRDLTGTLRLEDNLWAGPYTEGRKSKSGGHTGVTVNPRLKDMKKAFSPGDIVYVEVLRREGARIDLELVPIPMMEGSLVSYPVISGGVDTLVGGWDFDRNQTRRYLSDTRQVASTMKPIYYSLRYDQGMPPSTDLSGASFSGHGYDGHGKGKERIIAWESLLRSRDTSSQRVWSAALRAACQGARPEDGCNPEDKYRDWAKRMGFDDVERLLEAWGNEALGGNSQSPLAMARAYGTLAARGRAPRMPLVRKITDREGRVLERNIQPLDPHASFAETLTALWDITLEPKDEKIPKNEPRALGRRPIQQISPVTAFLTMANLVEVIKRGTGKRFRRPLANAKRGPIELVTKRLNREAAGKTGTLDYDVWFDGFTYDRTAVVWIGADNLERPLGSSREKSGVTASNTALPAWTDFMADVHGDTPVQEMTEKHGEPLSQQVGRIHVNPQTGLVPTCDCPPRTPCTPADGVPIYVRADAALDCELEEEEGDQISEDDL
ncbi:MAG: penicillin-binding transpeptidase domain-containing protein, partial [Myxococcota bacterium]|nr:penicillin-binding transpeptidase domain-containing protein [Myxococcota bacterium]